MSSRAASSDAVSLDDVGADLDDLMVKLFASRRSRIVGKTKVCSDGQEDSRPQEAGVCRPPLVVTGDDDDMGAKEIMELYESACSAEAPMPNEYRDLFKKGSKRAAATSQEKATRTPKKRKLATTSPKSSEKLATTSPTNSKKQVDDEDIEAFVEPYIDFTEDAQVVYKRVHSRAWHSARKKYAFLGADQAKQRAGVFARRVVCYWRDRASA